MQVSYKNKPTAPHVLSQFTVRAGSHSVFLDSMYLSGYGLDMPGSRSPDLAICREGGGRREVMHWGLYFILCAVRSKEKVLGHENGNFKTSLEFCMVASVQYYEAG